MPAKRAPLESQPVCLTCACWQRAGVAPSGRRDYGRCTARPPQHTVGYGHRCPAHSWRDRPTPAEG